MALIDLKHSEYPWLKEIPKPPGYDPKYVLVSYLFYLFHFFI